MICDSLVRVKKGKPSLQQYYKTIFIFFKYIYMLTSYKQVHPYLSVAALRTICALSVDHLLHILDFVSK